MAKEVLKDDCGRVIGYVDDRGSEQVVMDDCQRVVGYVNDRGTFDDCRRQVSQSKIPGLVLR